MLRILVTGAGGFIGQRLLAALAPLGHTVMAAVRDPQAFLAAHGEGLAARVFRLDLTAHGLEPKALFASLGSPDVLMHLAWGGLPHYRSPSHFETEAPSHYAFLKAMVQGGLRRLAATGTCLEYGLASGPLAETLPACPVTAYGLGKDILRRQLELLAMTSPFELLWCRLFYMYGLGQGAGSLYSLLRQAALRGDAEFPMSGGEQLRDYLPVEAVAQRLAKVSLLPEATGILNICSGRPVSIRSLVEQWIAAGNWRIEPRLGRYPYPDYEPIAFWGDAARLEAFLA